MSIQSKDIMIITIGDIKTQLITDLCKSIAAVFHLNYRLGNISSPPARAYDASRGQYLAEAILTSLHPGDAERVLGIVDVDIFMPDLNYVFGIADPQGKRAVISFTRLRESYYNQIEDQSLLVDRITKEALHELGHTYGIGHCRTRRCAMAFSNSLVDTDYQDANFCYTCKQAIF
jgi:archaemetzincin